ncbi:MAG: glycosyltransferase family 9 protein [Anaerolineae bacterium]|nr:glycosyltransferase family 9 protein [Anaerolineae bacterium]
MTGSASPRRIVVILPCCIGDVVMATPVLGALRDAYPDTHLTWAVGGWSKAAVERHPALDAVLDTGPAALPVKTWGGFWRFVGQLRAGKFDLAVSLVRSPLMSAAVLLSGIPQRAGLDSAGRGFGYTVRAPINPTDERHEAEIYLDVVRTLGIDTAGRWASCPPVEEDRAAAQSALDGLGISTPALADGLSQALGWPVVLTAGPNDAPMVEAVQAHLVQRAPALVGVLTLRQIAALAALSGLYVGNDTGLTHLAAAAGAKTAMLMGPTSPARYAPYTPDSLALWRPVGLVSGGVAAQRAAPSWDWARDGIAPSDALAQVLTWLGR